MNDVLGYAESKACALYVHALRVVQLTELKEQFVHLVGGDTDTLILHLDLKFDEELLLIRRCADTFGLVLVTIYRLDAEHVLVELLTCWSATIVITLRALVRSVEGIMLQLEHRANHVHWFITT